MRVDVLLTSIHRFAIHFKCGFAHLVTPSRLRPRLGSSVTILLRDDVIAVHAPPGQESLDFVP